jgi:hypothetical protein
MAPLIAFLYAPELSEISNSIVEDVSDASMDTSHKLLVDNVEEIKDWLSRDFPSLDRKILEELAQTTSSMHKLMRGKKSSVILIYLCF